MRRLQEIAGCKVDPKTGYILENTFHCEIDVLCDYCSILIKTEPISLEDSRALTVDKSLDPKEFNLILCNAELLPDRLSAVLSGDLCDRCTKISLVHRKELLSELSESQAEIQKLHRARIPLLSEIENLKKKVRLYIQLDQGNKERSSDIVNSRLREYSHLSLLRQLSDQLEAVIFSAKPASPEEQQKFAMSACASINRARTAIENSPERDDIQRELLSETPEQAERRKSASAKRLAFEMAYSTLRAQQEARKAEQKGNAQARTIHKKGKS